MRSRKSDIKKIKDIKEKYSHMYRNLMWSWVFALLSIVLTIFGASIVTGLIGSGIIVLSIIIYIFLINQELNDINLVVKQD